MQSQQLSSQAALAEQRRKTRCALPNWDGDREPTGEAAQRLLEKMLMTLSEHARADRERSKVAFAAPQLSCRPASSRSRAPSTKGSSRYRAGVSERLDEV